MDEFLSLALERPLEPQDVAAARGEPAGTIAAFCDRFAAHVAARYMAGSLSWEDADLAINHVFALLTRHCPGGPPDYAWTVYLAFDEAERLPTGSDDLTRRRLAALARGGGG